MPCDTIRRLDRLRHLVESGPRGAEELLCLLVWLYIYIYIYTHVIYYFLQLSLLLSLIISTINTNIVIISSVIRIRIVVGIRSLDREGLALARAAARGRRGLRRAGRPRELVGAVLGRAVRHEGQSLRRGGAAAAEPRAHARARGRERQS